MDAVIIRPACWARKEEGASQEWEEFEAFIKDEFSRVAGVLKVLVRDIPRFIVIEIYVEMEALLSAPLVYPKEAGIIFDDPIYNDVKYAEPWLKVQLAELRCQAHLARTYPTLGTILWEQLTCDQNGRILLAD